MTPGDFVAGLLRARMGMTPSSLRQAQDNALRQAQDNAFVAELLRARIITTPRSSWRCSRHEVLMMALVVVNTSDVATGFRSLSSGRRGTSQPRIERPATVTDRPFDDARRLRRGATQGAKTR